MNIKTTEIWICTFPKCEKEYEIVDADVEYLPCGHKFRNLRIKIKKWVSLDDMEEEIMNLIEYYLPYRPILESNNLKASREALYKVLDLLHSQELDREELANNCNLKLDTQGTEDSGTGKSSVSTKENPCQEISIRDILCKICGQPRDQWGYCKCR